MIPRRAFRRVQRGPGLDPQTVVRRIAEKIGTEYGRALTRQAFVVVERTGAPDQWVRAVQSARDAGAIAPEIAYFLIWKFVESAMLRVTASDSELLTLQERMEAAERAEGLEENESFYVGEGPPEWEEARIEWEAAFNARQAALFRMLGEEEMAEGVLRETQDPAFEAGRAAIFGPIEGPELEA